MKVLFLDIDGVMNNDGLLNRHGIYAVGEEMLDRLKRIVDATGCKIVLSSTWRLYKDAREVVDQKLATRGLEVIDETIEITPPKLSMFVPRSDEIEEWLGRNVVDQFAILDDCTDAGIEGHFFRTDTRIGLTDEITVQVIAHLGG